MNIFISTGGVRSHLVETINDFVRSGFNQIEVSGGLFCEDWEEAFLKIKEDTGALLQLHNYYASNEQPFVLNLASENEDVVRSSMQHCMKSIEMTAKLGSGYYAFHAGFLIDPQVGELGKKIAKRALYNRRNAISRFVKNCCDLYEHAEKNNIRLLIENNVLSKANLMEFGDNPLLMVEPAEILEVFDQLPKDINLLFDVAHAKVSANSLGIEKKIFVEALWSRIKALHLSDNDSLSDSNEPFLEDSWFVKYVKNLSLDFCTVEVYSENKELLKKQINLIEKLA